MEKTKAEPFDPAFIMVLCYSIAYLFLNLFPNKLLQGVCLTWNPFDSSISD